MEMHLSKQAGGDFAIRSLLSCSASNASTARAPSSLCFQENKTEYKSVTVVKDATAEEMTDFYLDDERRCRWVCHLAAKKLSLRIDASRIACWPVQSNWRQDRHEIVAKWCVGFVAFRFPF